MKVAYTVESLSRDLERVRLSVEPWSKGRCHDRPCARTLVRLQLVPPIVHHLPGGRPKVTAYWHYDRTDAEKDVWVTFDLAPALVSEVTPLILAAASDVLGEAMDEFYRFRLLHRALDCTEESRGEVS